jgi:hypothetical protein
MSAVVADPAERKYCLERVLDINAKHEAAQRGLTKFPPALISRSPLPDSPPPISPTLCNYPGCSQPVSRTGHSLCYDHWKQTKRPKSSSSSSTAGRWLTASHIGEQVNLSSQRVNLLLAEIGWIERQGPNWVVSSQGQLLGALQRHYPETGRSYVVWPEHILEHKVLRAAIQTMRGDTSEIRDATTSDHSFRERFPATHRTTDGHLVRSKAEMLIDNWLYMSGIIHAYERQLPIEEDVYCDFYLPTGKVYIEYWGIENDPTYTARRKTKVGIYQRHNLQLIELTDDHILKLDDVFPKMLLKYKIAID